MLAGFAITILVGIGPGLAATYRVSIVLSGSMEPALPVGSLIISAVTRATDLGVGDVITFTRPDRPETPVTHRIALVDAPDGTVGFVTKGDANGSDDGARIIAAGSFPRVVAVVPGAGYALAFMRAPILRLLLAIGFCVLGALTVAEALRPRRIALAQA